jgi:hypothetical protein
MYWADAGSYSYNEWLSYDALPDEAVAPVAALLAEHALWSGRGPDLERLARLKKPDAAFDVLREIVVLAGNPNYASPAVRAVATWGGGRAVKELRRLADEPQKMRADVLVEAALLLDDPAAVGILDAVQATAEKLDPKDRYWQEAAALAAELTPAVKGDREALRKLLQHERPAIRGTAARLLLRQGDTAGVGILLDELVQQQAGQALHTRHELVSRGKPVLDALKPFEQEPAGSPRRVLAAAVARRINEPALAAKFDRAIVYRSFGFQTRMGPRTEDFRITGRHIAAEAGKEAVPLLEAEVLAAGNWGNGEVAAFALAVFKQQPSIDLLVGVLRDLKRADRSRGLTAHAIRDFGEEGFAAIKDIPAPDPDKPAFDTRAGRFRGATEALADVDPKTAAENVIKGLTALAAEPVQKDAAWADRVRGFLRLAEKVEDPAIIAPILAVIQCQRDSVESAAFHILSRFEDPRLTEPALEALLSPRGDSARWRSDQLLTLARQLKDQTAARLVKELKDSKDAARRARAAEALPRLIADQSSWPAIYPRKDNHLPYNATKDDLPTRRQSAVESLTLAAAKLDLARGYPMLMKLFPTLDEGEFRQYVGVLLEQIQQQPAKGKR